MLSFEITRPAKADVIQIMCDAEGLAHLIHAPERVREQGHLHLRAPKAGGHDLSDVTPFGDPAVGEVIVTTGGY